MTHPRDSPLKAYDIKLSDNSPIEGKERKVVYLDCEVLDDGTNTQFTQIGCYSKHDGFESSFFTSIVPDKLENYKKYKQSVNLLTILNLECDEESKEYTFSSNGVDKVAADSQNVAINKLLSYFNKIGTDHDLIIVVNSPDILQCLVHDTPSYMPSSTLNMISGFITTNSLLGTTEAVDTEDLYQNAFGKAWEKENTTCEDTAKYLHNVVTQLSLLTLEVLDKNVREICSIEKKRTKQDKDSRIESIEITNYSRSSLPVTIQCTYIDLIDLTSVQPSSSNNHIQEHLGKSEGENITKKRKSITDGIHQINKDESKVVENNYDIQEIYWMCRLCLEVFRTVTELEKHYETGLTHTFICHEDGCKNIMTTQHHLVVHTWEVHLKKTEDLCDKCEMWRKNHKKKRHIHSCTQCRIFTVTSDQLWKHKVKKHGYGRCANANTNKGYAKVFK